MKKITILSTSAALMTALIMTGCGGGSNSNSSEHITIAGKAIDPYLREAKVCLDLNDNGECEINEPSSQTNAYGEYALDIAKEYHESQHALIVSGGTDIGTNTAFTGTLTALKIAGQTVQNITPLTTMVEARHHHCKTHHDSCHESVDEITSNVANYLGLTEEQINSDIVTLANSGQDKPLKTALALETSAESHAQEDPYSFYTKMGQNGFSIVSDWKNDVKVLIPNKAELVTTIMNIDAGTLEEIAINTEDTSHQIAQYVHGIVHQMETEAANTAANTAVETATTAHETAHQVVEEMVVPTATEAANTAANTAVETATKAHEIAHQVVEEVVVPTATETANTAVETATKAHETAHQVVEEVVVPTATETANTAVETATTAHETAHQVGEVVVPATPRNI